MASQPLLARTGRFLRSAWWGVVGAALSAGGVLLFFYEKKPHVTIDVVAASSILDVRQSIDGLLISFRGQDIRENNKDLAVVTLNVINDGDIDIVESLFDVKSDWGFRIAGAQLIDPPRIVHASQPYLQDAARPEQAAPDTVRLGKFIFDRGSQFTVEVRVLHAQGSQIEITPFGKIAGLEKIDVKRSWLENKDIPFWRSIFSGSLGVNVARLVVFGLIILLLLVLLVFLAFAVTSVSEWRATRQRRVIAPRLSFGDLSPKAAEIIRTLYVDGGWEALATLVAFLIDPPSVEALASGKVPPARRYRLHGPRPWHLAATDSPVPIETLREAGVVTDTNGKVAVDQRFVTEVERLIKAEKPGWDRAVFSHHLAAEHLD